MVIFPEGTRLTPKTFLKSIQYARENSLPLLKHHLCPRTRGILWSLQMMTNIDAVYDIVLAFKHEDKDRAVFSTILNGETLEAHLYIRRIPFNEVPKSEEKVNKFVNDMFLRKVINNKYF